MNLRFKLALIRHFGTRNSDNKGFAIVIALGLGLVMIVIGLTMVIRSQSDQVLGSTQKNTSRALSAAEVGVSRYQNLINKARLLTSYPDCVAARSGTDSCTDSGNSVISWKNAANIPGISTTSVSCGNSITTLTPSQITTNISYTPQVVDSNTSYRLISYTYSGIQPNDPSVSSLATGAVLGTGTLTVEGQVNSTTSAAGSTARLEVKIPVKKSDPGSLPGLWLATGNTSSSPNNAIAGNVLLSDCNASTSGIRLDNTLPAGQTNNYTAKNTNRTIPTIPTQPASGVISLNSIGTLTLPRVGDTAITFQGNSNVYVYTASAITDSLTITPGQKVVIYLSGSIPKNANIDHSCVGYAGAAGTCLPTNFQIFGTGTTGQICANGNRKIEAFILAPTYSGGVNGTGGGQGGIKGSLFIKDWGNIQGCGSNTQNTAVEQTGNWSSSGFTPVNFPPYIDTPSSWEKKPVPQ